MTKYANLSDNQRLEIEQKVKDAGYLILEESKPVNVVMCEEVVCPLCDSSLEIYTSGNSYRISCHTHGRVIVVRAFASPNFI